MIGIGQLDLTAQFPQIMRRNSALNGALGSYVHKDRGLDCAMCAGKFSTARLPLCFDYLKQSKNSNLCY